MTAGASTPAPPPPQQASYTPPPPAGGGFAGSASAPPMQIPNYLWQSIVVTLCCCLPLGIVAIIFAAQVNQKLAVGDIAGAQNASKQAKMWCWIAFGLGIVGFVIGMLINGAAIMQILNEAKNH